MAMSDYYPAERAAQEWPPQTSVPGPTCPAGAKAVSAAPTPQGSWEVHFLPSVSCSFPPMCFLLCTESG